MENSVWPAEKGKLACFDVKTPKKRYELLEIKNEKTAYNVNLYVTKRLVGAKPIDLPPFEEERKYAKKIENIHFFGFDELSKILSGFDAVSAEKIFETRTNDVILQKKLILESGGLFELVWFELTGFTGLFYFKKSNPESMAEFEFFTMTVPQEGMATFMDVNEEKGYVKPKTESFTAYASQYSENIINRLFCGNKDVFYIKVNMINLGKWSVMQAFGFNKKDNTAIAKCLDIVETDEIKLTKKTLV